MSSSVDVADAVVIGSGPNGLVAAVTLARAGWNVVVLERADVPGGAVRSEALTLPGYTHDVYSAFYGLLHATPVFRKLELDTRVRWADFDVPVGAAIDPLNAAFIHSDPERTARDLGALEPSDEAAWIEMFRWWQKIGTRFFATMLAPIPSIRPALRFALAARIRGAIDTTRMLLAPAETVARERFTTELARVLLIAGTCHSDLAVDQTGSSPMALILAMLGQDVGFPVPVGGAGKITEALVASLDEAGGKVRTSDAVAGVVVERGRANVVETEGGFQVKARHAVLADTGPLALFRDLVGEDHVPSRYLDGLQRFRYGTGIFKLDLALDAPAPWLVDEGRRCGVFHLTGDVDNMSRAAFEARRGFLPTNPMLIVGQQSIADPTRAPEGAQTLWIETHVPSTPVGDGAGTLDVQGWDDAREPFGERVLARLEAHAPGLRDHIVGTAVRTPVDLQAENPNLVGGDLGGGSSAIDQQLIFRPVPGWFRYRTPVKGLYLCSASAHPGGGVHGMAGYNCARRVISDARRPAGIVRTATGARRRPR